MIGVVYPTIRSIIALESPEKNDDTQWLTYWSIYGILALLDEATSVLLTRIPGYFFFKVLFLIYLFSPLSMGAQKIYDVIVKPLLTKYQA
jgi:receptor expression-enhancing protein 5/6